ncbi:MAG: PAS domain S-box protein [Candidatus Hadarchaeaceae archaeon]
MKEKKHITAKMATKIIDAMMDAVVITDLGGVITQFNKALTESFGWGQEVIGELPTIFVVERDIPKVVDGIKECIEKGFLKDLECTGLTKAKKEVRVLLNATLVKDLKGNPEGIIAIIRDITEFRRLQEKEKEASAAKMAADVIDAMSDGLVLLSMDGKITFINSAFEKMSGYKKSELVGKDATELISKNVKLEDTKKAMGGLETVLKGKIPPFVPFTIIKKDGHELPIIPTVTFVRDTEGKPAIIVFTARNITELKRAEESMNLLSTAVRTSIDAISVASPVDGKLIFCNDAFLKQWKVKGDYRNLHYTDCFDADPDVLKKIVQATMAGGWTGELTAKTMDGQLFLVLVTSSPVVDKEGKIVGLLGIFKDITKLKLAEEALRKRTSDLRDRVKELNCLYGISDLVEKPGTTTLEEILQGVVNLIPPAWQYPVITCARILVEDKEYKTKNFKETNWRQASDIIVRGERIGAVEVYYLEERPESDEGPFLKEERSLINAIAKRMGGIIEHKRAEEELKTKIKELEEFHELVVGRELKMKRMEAELERLKAKLGEK